MKKDGPKLLDRKLTKEIGNRIKTLRERRGLSQQELGDKTGFSRVMIVHWETAASQPRIESIVLLANALDTDPAWLAGFKEKTDDRGHDFVQDWEDWLDGVHSPFTPPAPSVVPPGT